MPSPPRPIIEVLALPSPSTEVAARNAEAVATLPPVEQLPAAPALEQPLASTETPTKENPRPPASPQEFPQAPTPPPVPPIDVPPAPAVPPVEVPTPPPVEPAAPSSERSSPFSEMLADGATEFFLTCQKNVRDAGGYALPEDYAQKWFRPACMRLADHFLPKLPPMVEDSIIVVVPGAYIVARSVQVDMLRARAKRFAAAQPVPKSAPPVEKKEVKLPPSQFDDVIKSMFSDSPVEDQAAQ